MEISNTVIQGAITLLFSVVSFGLSIWVRNLTTTIEKLRDGQAEMHLLFQLKTDAARDHAQVLQIFTDIKLSMERINERMDRLIDGTGGH
ncbi:Uncharacterised protein [Cedecea neteri]|uniref:Uncharacterized protein n=1 Tax=Cedecea neteri TaxID=158822 RepID=A0A291DX63_9ENTR|nr:MULTISPECIES: hypothetical protein [Cedecea]ATF92401.1 hypothetical protein CO704_10040 [Cedecea neteri]ATF92823.1 hypothetical protein CO704_12315 [Cedecea neteri]ATF93669.1 hypothetical protein CO704_16895 [Cedecea neteri]SMG61925.1 hypothetical protein SAMN03159353_10796 [Cedecea sp. NFIX57]SQA96714.1 Uncharacterised protein [Cedecea neteri]